MTTSSKRLLIGGTLCLLIVAGFFYLSKAGSINIPKDTVEFHQSKLELEIVYSRPYRKGRKVFGGIVPYGEVWRPGGNQAPVFKTNQDLLVDGSLLPAGTYTLWIIPHQNSWKIIFNSKWRTTGVKLSSLSSREEAYDVLVMERPTKTLNNLTEQFTVAFTEEHDLVFLVITWDRISVQVPIRKKMGGTAGR